MTNTEFTEHYLPRYASVMRAIARKLARSDDILVEDLYQEGLVALWLCKPERAHKNQDAYIRQALRFRMIDYLRKVHAYTFDSLDYRLEQGEQLVINEDGETCLVKPWGMTEATFRTHRMDRASIEGEG